MKEKERVVLELSHGEAEAVYAALRLLAHGYASVTPRAAGALDAGARGAWLRVVRKIARRWWPPDGRRPPDAGW